ncbi:MAG: hypothetical protein AAGI28_07870 [Pseudomonadota bacterium]
MLRKLMRRTLKQHRPTLRIQQAHRLQEHSRKQHSQRPHNPQRYSPKPRNRSLYRQSLRKWRQHSKLPRIEPLPVCRPLRPQGRQQPSTFS